MSLISKGIVFNVKIFGHQSKKEQPLQFYLKLNWGGFLLAISRMHLSGHCQMIGLNSFQAIPYVSSSNVSIRHSSACYNFQRKETSASIVHSQLTFMSSCDSNKTSDSTPKSSCNKIEYNQSKKINFDNEGNIKTSVFKQEIEYMNL